MIYNVNNKKFYIADEVIDDLVNKLDISISEACEVYLTDNGYLKNDTVEELTKKAKPLNNTIHQAKSDKKTSRTREKKENPLKKEIIETIFTKLTEHFGTKGQIIVKNTEKYIDLFIEDREFTINLVEHRKKK